MSISAGVIVYLALGLQAVAIHAVRCEVVGLRFSASYVLLGLLWPFLLMVIVVAALTNTARFPEF